MNINNNNNIQILNSLRAFAALSVCMYHFVCTTTGFIHNQMILDVFSNGKYGVQMFFVISGFVIPWAMYNSKYRLNNIFQFILKRLARLEPPYIVSMILAIVLIIARKKILHNNDVDFSATQIALHFGYMIPFFKHYNWLNQVYWTLAIEFQYYIVVAFAFPLLISKNKYVRYFLYILFLGLSMFNNPYFLPHWLSVFLIGMILFLYLKGLIHKYEMYTVLIALSTFALFYYGAGNTFYILVAIVCILFFRDKDNRLGSFLGEFSYSIYLIHPIIGAAIINYFSRNVTGWQKAGLIFIGLAVTLLCSWLMYLVVEKPSKKLSSGIKYKKSC